MADIFICYRRDDSGAGQAGRLYDRLRNHFGHNRVFFDIDSLQFGDNFVEKIQGVLGRCAVALVVIGRDWLVRDEHNRIRLKNNNDYVRLEIAMALKRQGTKVIPVRVHGGKMPAKRDLPADLAPLLEHHGPELRDVSWDRDVQSLIRRLERIVGKPGGKAAGESGTKPPRKGSSPPRKSAGTSGRKGKKSAATPEKARENPSGSRPAAKAPAKQSPGSGRKKKPVTKHTGDPKPRGTASKTATKSGTPTGAGKSARPTKTQGGPASPGGSRTKSGPAKRIGTGPAPRSGGKANSKPGQSSKPGKAPTGGAKRGTTGRAGRGNTGSSR
jgi:hypothetical protein